MKKGAKKHNATDKVKWRIWEWSNSIYPACLKWLLVSLVVLICVNYDNKIDTRFDSILTSIYTGVIASVVVAIFIQKKQDSIILDKKKALLFDAGFLLDGFAKKYSHLKKESNIDWVSKYKTCEEVALYLSDLYKYHKDIFDVIELNYMRAINSSLFFIKRLLDCDTDGCDEKVVALDKKYNELISELVENLFCLIIKWNHDGITSIELK